MWLVCVCVWRRLFLSNKEELRAGQAGGGGREACHLIISSSSPPHLTSHSSHACGWVVTLTCTLTTSHLSLPHYILYLEGEEEEEKEEGTQKEGRRKTVGSGEEGWRCYLFFDHLTLSENVSLTSFCCVCLGYVCIISVYVWLCLQLWGHVPFIIGNLLYYYFSGSECVFSPMPLCLCSCVPLLALSQAFPSLRHDLMAGGEVRGGGSDVCVLGRLLCICVWGSILE